MNTELIWQTRDEMDVPTNPLQELREILTRTSRDVSEDKMIACLYGIIVGWDDASYQELKEKHGWSDGNIKWQKTWHSNYCKAWNLYMVTKKAEGVYVPVSAEERLPEKEGWVGVMYKDGLVDSFYYKRGSFHGSEDCSRVAYVDHWLDYRPLPDLI